MLQKYEKKITKTTFRWKNYQNFRNFWHNFNISTLIILKNTLIQTSFCTFVTESYNYIFNY